MGQAGLFKKVPLEQRLEASGGFRGMDVWGRAKASAKFEGRHVPGAFEGEQGSRLRWSPLNLGTLAEHESTVVEEGGRCCGAV